MSLLNYTSAAELPAHLDVHWLWHERVAMGTVAMLGGTGGVGKSILVAALELCVAAGIPFLDAEVASGEVLHLDFDTDPRLQGPWYRRVAAGLGLPETHLSRIRYVEPSGNGPPYLIPERLEELASEVQAMAPVLLVIDAWTSAFPFIRGSDMGEVAQVMAALREMARSGPAVLVLDHTPKPIAHGPSALERGLIGSTMKQAGARAVHLLQRVPPREVQGRDVQVLHTLKNNLAALAEPVGIERTWHAGGAVTFTTCDLPEAENSAPAMSRALRAIREIIGTVPVALRTIVDEVARRANVAERTTRTALAQLVGRGELVRVQSGREVMYVLTSDKGPAEADIN